MTRAWHVGREVPATTTAAELSDSLVFEIELEALEHPVLRTVVRAWDEWRGPRPMPARSALSLRSLGAAARHISLTRVVDGGADYEFRIVGDAHVEAYGKLVLKRMSDVIAATPRFGHLLKNSFDRVRESGKPLAYRGAVGASVPDARFVWFETCYLPFGEDGEVTHIVNAAVYTPRAESRSTASTDAP